MGHSGIHQLLSTLCAGLALISPCNVVFYLSGTPPSHQSWGYEAFQPTFRRLHRWRVVVVFLGHLIRRWAPSTSYRSTSKATWQHSIVTTRRDMPGGCSAASSGQESEWKLCSMFCVCFSFRLEWKYKFLSPFRKKSVSRHQSQPLSPDIIRLKDMVSEFPSTRPFDHLEVIATLGVGGFGRVELVRPESFIPNGILLF